MADKWITTKNGNHVLIKDGETFDEAINKHEDKEQEKVSKHNIQKLLNNKNWQKEDFFMNKYNRDITNDFDGKNLFDTNTTDYPLYNKFLKNNNIGDETGTIEQMTPNEYYKEGSKIHNISFEERKRITEMNNDNLSMLASIVNEKGKQLAMPFIDYSKQDQDGYHRMYLAGEMFGWDTKQPVLVIKKK